MKKVNFFFSQAGIYFVWFPAIIISIAGACLYFRVSGDIQVCRAYYPEMSLPGCYFSSKTVRVPGYK